MGMLLRTPILAASRSGMVRTMVSRAPVSRGVVSRFVAGERVEEALEVSAGLSSSGLLVSLDHLGEDTRTPEQAAATTAAYTDLLGRLGAAGLAGSTEVSLKLTAVGLDLDPELAVANADAVCAAAAAAGTTVTVDMEDSSRTEATLAVVGRLRERYPWTGAVLQAYLRRTESDCRALAGSGSRVRLCKGAYQEPVGVAFQGRAEVEASYRRCLQVLMAGDGYPMVATHDPALLTLAEKLVQRNGRSPDSYELQMLYGIRPDAQRRLAEAGHRMRIYVPYGADWYGYLMRRLAERPANVAFFLRALASRS
jgi:proline dehydrogenase